MAEITYTPVTFENGFVVTARFAPDGNTIVYSADWDGQPRGVYVTSIENREYRPLGFPGADLAGISRSGDLAILNGSTVTGGNPFWRLGTLARASLTGGAPRAELEGVHFADFGPGGSFAVVRKHPRMKSIEYPVGQVLAEASTSEEYGFAAPRVSPSGDHVAFFDLRVPGAFKVRVFDRAGKLVTESRPFSDWWALAWTPANEVWFAAAETSGTQTAIYSLDLEGRQRTVYRAPGAITLHDISPEGDVLVSFDRGKSRIEVIDGDGTAPQARVWREGGRLSAWSASRAMLINAIGDIGGPQGSVYVWPQTEAQPIRIGEGAGSALSPDGSKALVSSHRPPITVSIVLTGAGQPQRVDSGPLEQISWAGWLPDGRLVVQGVRSGSGSAVSVFSAAGRDPAPLLPDGVALRGHNLISPDGSRIAAIDAGGGIVVCTVAMPACRPVPGTRADDVVSGWASDNQSLFVHQRQREQPQVGRIGRRVRPADGLEDRSSAQPRRLRRVRADGLPRRHGGVRLPRGRLAALHHRGSEVALARSPISRMTSRSGGRPFGPLAGLAAGGPHDGRANSQMALTSAAG